MKILLTPFVKKKNKYLQLSQFYTNALIDRGGLPIIVPITEDTSLLDRYLQGAEGLLVTGGVDVDPSFYGEDKKETCEYTHSVQDTTAFYLIKQAIKKNIPIFGICRGLQIINVYFGGTLYQDLNTDYDSTINHNPNLDDGEYAHSVAIEKDALLHSIIKTDSINVNSVHHQAIKSLGEGIKINAKAKDGVIEAIEGENGILAVQWHPELLQANDENHAKLFDYFMTQVKNRRVD